MLIFYCQDEYFSHPSQWLMIFLRARCVTAEQGTVVLMREEDGQASLTTHTAFCLSLWPPIISLMWPSPSTKKATASLAVGSQMQITAKY